MQVSKAKNNWLLFITVLVVFFALLFNSSAVAISVVAIKHNLHLNFVMMEWTLVAYFTFVVALMGLFGQMGDRYGSTPIFLWGIIITLVGVIILSASHGVATLMVGRIIQAIGVAMIVPNSIYLVKRCLVADKLQFGLRIWAAVVFLSYSAGIFLGAIMTAASWKLNFWILYLPLVPGLYIIYNLRKSFSEQKLQRNTKFDLIGAVLLLAAIITTVFLFTLPPIYGWTSPFIITMICVAPVLILAFLWYELKVDGPIINIRICKNPQFLMGISFVFLSMFALFAFFYSAILYSQSPILGKLSIIKSGAELLPAFVPIPLLAFYNGYLQRKIGQTAVLLIGWVLLAAGVFLLLFTFRETTYVNLWWRYVMIGAGVGLLYPSAVSFSNSSLPFEQTGMASGIMTMLQVLGAVLGISISQVWYVARFNGIIDAGLHKLEIYKYDHFKVIDAVHTSNAAVDKVIASMPHQDQVRVILRTAITKAYAYGNFTGAIAAFAGLAIMLGIVFARVKRAGK